jgi:hypothetical protein
MYSEAVKVSSVEPSEDGEEKNLGLFSIEDIV